MDLGASLGPYRIDRELGAGGMGKVYAGTAGDTARAVAPGATVALKVVHPHLLETPGFFRRFMREAEIGQAVRHPNVVRTLDCDSVVVDGQRHDYLAMEYVEGQTLRDLLDEMERVPEELCRHIGREVSKGLAAIHEAGAVHRDLKPENVLITPDHVVKVMDLGVARLMDEAVRLSQTGAFVGSLHYAAPEQFDGGGKDLDGRADLHALGLVLYELSTGQHPFLAESVPEIVKHVLRTEPRKVGQIHPQLSAFFEEAVQCLLAKDRDNRFASATALHTALEAGEESRWWRARARSIQAETKRPIRRIRIPRETAVYGRERELAQLTTLYEAAQAGDGHVVLIQGEAGIGKSRLVDELVVRLQSSGEDLNFLFGSYPPGGAATMAGGFSCAFREHFGEPGSAEYLAETPLLAPAFDAVLRGDPSPAGVASLTSDTLGTCFVRATHGLAAERPTVILIDDLHFAPRDARNLFTALTQAVPGHRVLLVGTMRRGVPEEWVANVTRLDQVTALDVPRIGPKDLALLLEESFKSEELATALGHQLAIKSDGNPFFAFEIIRGLREGKFITQRDDGTWVSTEVIDKIQIPSSVLDLVNARVADLNDEDKDLLEVASCWGYEFDPVLVAEAAGVPVVAALKRFGRIEKSHRLVRASGRSVAFDHHQVQEALYSGILEQLREHYHAALADALAARTSAAEKDPAELDGALCVDLCEHYLDAARGEDAVRYLEAATNYLAEGYLLAHVEELTERALAIPDLLTGAERVTVLLQLCFALHKSGRQTRHEKAVREAERLAERLAAQTGDDLLRCQVARSLGEFLTRASRLNEAEAAYERALELARAVADKAAEARTLGRLGIVYYNLGRMVEARETFERARSLHIECGDRAGEAVSTGNLGNAARALGHPSEARACYERALSLSRELGDRRSEAGAATNLGNLLVALLRTQEAKAYLERGLTLSREAGDRRWEAFTLQILGSLFGSVGRTDEGRRYAERCLLVSRETGDRRREAYALHDLGYEAWWTGRIRESEERFSEALAVSEEVGDRYQRCRAQLALGALRVAERLGEERARASLVAARDGYAELGDVGSELRARCWLAVLDGRDAADAEAAFAEHEDRLEPNQQRETRWLLFRATGDRAHLTEAKRLLDEEVARLPEEDREPFMTNVLVSREILAALREEFGEEGDAAPADNEPGEFPTRAG